MSGNNEQPIDAEMMPAVMDSARALALLAKETPEVIMARAVRAAKVLKDVVDKKPDPVKMGDQTYLEIEDWQTLGNFFNLAAQVDKTNFVQYGNAQGFEAFAAVVDKITGRVVSKAEAMCLNDEAKWCARAKYAYHYVTKDGSLSAEDPGSENIVWEDNPYNPGKKRPKKEKVKVGDEPVPLFQLRSMAQTRACAKALRLAVGWVVVLAGYKATPAEELDGMTDKETGRSQGAGQPTGGQQGGQAGKPAGKPAARAQGAAAPAQATPPVRKQVKGVVTGHVPPKGNSKYTGFIMNGVTAEQLQTADETLRETMMNHGKAKDVITVDIDESVNGRYVNRYIVGITIDPADQTPPDAAK